MKSRSSANLVEIIHRADIEGMSGDCGAAAMAINQVLFNGSGEYIAVIPEDEDLSYKIAMIDHVGVLYGGKIYDHDGFSKWGFTKRTAIGNVVNLSAVLGQSEAERTIRNSLHPGESYGEKVRRLTNAIKTTPSK